MYEPPREETPGCRDTLVLTRAAYGLLLPPLIGMFAVLALITGAVFLFAVHPALALLPVALLAGAIYVFARWDRNRNIPPGL
ncbi:MAG: hypothetical protein IIC89_05645 [Chloroflexi bacterium]|nr:hypothetical protein [Chloroflexota bacterium]